MIYVEALEVEDVHRAPIAPKLLETRALKHSRSEEHLASGETSFSGNGSLNNSNNGQLGNGAIIPQVHQIHHYNIETYGGPDPDHMDCWSQEDDEIITANVIVPIWSFLKSI